MGILDPTKPKFTTVFACHRRVNYKTVQLRILSDSIGEKKKKFEDTMITIVSQAQENVLMLTRHELTA